MSQLPDDPVAEVKKLLDRAGVDPETIRKVLDIVGELERRVELGYESQIFDEE